MATKNRTSKLIPFSIHNGSIYDIKWLDSKLYLTINVDKNSPKPQQLSLCFYGVNWMRELSLDKHYGSINEKQYTDYSLIDKNKLNENYKDYVESRPLKDITISKKGIVFVNDILFFNADSVEIFEKHTFKTIKRNFLSRIFHRLFKKNDKIIHNETDYPKFSLSENALLFITKYAIPALKIEGPIDKDKEDMIFEYACDCELHMIDDDGADKTFDYPEKERDYLGDKYVSEVSGRWGKDYLVDLDDLNRRLGFNSTNEE